MISFACDVCGQPCGNGHARTSIMIQHNASLPAGFGNGEKRWLRGISIIMWDQEAAGSGRYHHVHIEKCLATWIARHKTALLKESSQHSAVSS